MKEVRQKKPHIVRVYLYELSRVGKSVEIKGRLVATRGLKKEEIGSDYLMGRGFLLG